MVACRNGAQQNALFPVGMPLDEDVRHRHRIAGERMAGAKFLQCDRGPQLLKAIDQEFLLGHDGLRTAQARAEIAKLFQVRVGLGAVERDILQL